MKPAETVFLVFPFVFALYTFSIIVWLSLHTHVIRKQRHFLVKLGALLIIFLVIPVLLSIAVVFMLHYLERIGK